MIIDPKEIKHKLLQLQFQGNIECPPLPGLNIDDIQPAAVLIPLVLDEGSWKILFIKRTSHKNDQHSGQIAFPGGRADTNDPSLLMTALREAEEEIGIKPADVDILGQSCSITTVTNYTVTPFVGILPWPYTITASRIEVEKTLLIPMDWLNNPSHYQTKLWNSAPKSGRELSAIFYKEYQGETLWGATAQIVMDFLEIIQYSP
jgi:8-oxo-dGTP pyrophosphatase MutT (NUDIX family)